MIFLQGVRWTEWRRIHTFHTRCCGCNVSSVGKAKRKHRSNSGKRETVKSPTLCSTHLTNLSDFRFLLLSESCARLCCGTSVSIAVGYERNHRNVSGFCLILIVVLITVFTDRKSTKSRWALDEGHVSSRNRPTSLPSSWLFTKGSRQWFTQCETWMCQKYHQFKVVWMLR